MEFFFIILVSVCLCFLLIKPLLSPSKPKTNLPPGPSKISLLSKFILGRKSFSELGPIISNFSQKYGPLITIPLGSKPTIYITNSALAHKAFVQNGNVFADRPDTINKLIVSNSHRLISKSPYGPVWRALRRNLTAGALHPTQVKSFYNIKKRVVDNLISRLRRDFDGGKKALFMEEYFRRALISLQILLCFGEIVSEDQIKEMESAQISLFANIHRFKLFVFPRIGKFFFKKQWTELTGILNSFDRVSRPIVQARGENISDRGYNNFYVDTLLNLQLPGEEGNITEDDIVGLCGEFVNAGTDSMLIALLWIMANVVKYPKIQERILEDIKNVIGDENNSISDEIRSITDEDLNKMPYVKAVVLEGLRLHPPGYAPMTPHAVTEDVEFEGCTLPKGTQVNFSMMDMGRDPKVWENPTKFQPERFMKSDEVQSFDVTGDREIKMMPFGAGRRICPGYALAMLHMEYLVANLVWNFQWSTVDGKEVDLSEKFGLYISMKNPLQVLLSPRV